jgi:hypothetical protein
MTRMQKTTTAHLAVIAIFLMAILGIPLFRFANECANGRYPSVLEIFHHKPTSANLSDWERRMGEEDFFSVWVRSIYPKVLFEIFGDSTGNVIAGRDGWLFYKQSVDTGTQKGEVWGDEDLAANAGAAIKQLQAVLNKRGVELVVIPIPNKESIYPDKLVGGSAPQEAKTSDRTCRFSKWLGNQNIPHVDLFKAFAKVRSSERPHSLDLYLKQDSHWSPYGASVAAVETANFLRERGYVSSNSTDIKPQEFVSRIEAPSDLYDMLKKSWRPNGPEFVDAPESRKTSNDSSDSAQVILLGDSFLNCYHEKGQGFTASLQAYTGYEIADIVSIGSSAKAVQELQSQIKRFPKARLVIWLFAERKLAFSTGIEGKWR